MASFFAVVLQMQVISSKYGVVRLSRPLHRCLSFLAMLNESLTCVHCGQTDLLQLNSSQVLMSRSSNFQCRGSEIDASHPKESGNVAPHPRISIASPHCLNNCGGYLLGNFVGNAAVRWTDTIIDKITSKSSPLDRRIPDAVLELFHCQATCMLSKEAMHHLAPPGRIIIILRFDLSHYEILFSGNTLRLLPRFR